MRIAHIITRLILGGAQENTLLSCEDLMRIHGEDVLLVTGPPLGPEGSLLDRAIAGGVPTRVIPNCAERSTLARLDQLPPHQADLRQFKPEVVHTHSAKAGVLGRAAATALGVPAIVHGVHGAPFHPYQSPVSRAVFRACERWAASRCHAFVSVRRCDDRSHGERRSGPAREVHYGLQRHGVEPFLESGRSRERIRCQLGYRPEHVVIGKIARLFVSKVTTMWSAQPEQVVRMQPNARFPFRWRWHLRSEAAGARSRRPGWKPTSNSPVWCPRSGFPNSCPRWTSWSTQACAKDSPACCPRP